MTARLDDAALARERSILLGLWLDLGILLPYAAVAIWANSLTLIGEALRGSIFVGLEVALLLTLRRIHRGRTADYDFGAGKIEQFANFAVGAALIGGAAYMFWGLVGRAATPPGQPALGLAFAVGASLLNLVLNLVALRAQWKAGRDGTSIIMAAQIRSRLSKVVSSALVVVAVLVNAMAGAGGIGTIADLAGAALVAVLMTSFGIGMWRAALPSLLDRTLDEARQGAINRVLASRFDSYAALGIIRTRMSGRDPMIEIALGFEPQRTVAEVQALRDAVQADMEALIPGARVTLIPFAVPAAA